MVRRSDPDVELATCAVVYLRGVPGLHAQLEGVLIAFATTARLLVSSSPPSRTPRSTRHPNHLPERPGASGVGAFLRLRRTLGHCRSGDEQRHAGLSPRAPSVIRERRRCLSLVGPGLADVPHVLARGLPRWPKAIILRRRYVSPYSLSISQRKTLETCWSNLARSVSLSPSDIHTSPVPARPSEPQVKSSRRDSADQSRLVRARRLAASRHGPAGEVEVPIENIQDVVGSLDAGDHETALCGRVGEGVHRGAADRLGDLFER